MTPRHHIMDVDDLVIVDTEYSTSVELPHPQHPLSPLTSPTPTSRCDLVQKQEIGLSDTAPSGNWRCDSYSMLVTAPVPKQNASNPEAAADGSTKKHHICESENKISLAAANGRTVNHHVHNTQRLKPIVFPHSLEVPHRVNDSFTRVQEKNTYVLPPVSWIQSWRSIQ
jgi:hypothetical protein